MDNEIINSEYKALRELSTRIGSDPLQVQGAGGNTSLKTDGLMWIKASGTWLAHAVDTELFVPVELDPLLVALNAGDPRAEKSVAFVNESLNPNNLRPSIETTVHAVLPQKVVVHIHCVDTIALAVQSDAQRLLGELLHEYKWLWVPYCRPGLPLSRYISANLEPGTNVIVLGNHGLVVAADTVEQAATLLQQVRFAVQQNVRPAQPPNLDALQALCNNTDYKPASGSGTHAVAMDEHCLATAAGGSMYPDHVIFLGEGSVIMDSSESLEESTHQHEAKHGSRPASIIVSGEGVLMNEEANASQHALARCLSDVCLRISANASIRYLDANDHNQLLNWEAEAFRQSIAK